MMKKTILSLMGAMSVCTAFAANCATVRQIGTDYASHQITIALTRNGCTGDATNHRNTVWVFVDYRAVGNSSWTRAAISAASAGTVVNSGSSKGVWIYGANGTQTVMLTLSGMPAKYEWCAFATDYPPNVAMFNNGTYTLSGTAPFLLNGNTAVNSNTYVGAAISSITDATGCPGIACGHRDANVGAGGCCLSGLTPVNGYCRDLAADNAVVLNCSGTGAFEAGKQPAGQSQTYVLNQHCAAGWRWPTPDELRCMWSNRTRLTLANAFIWSNTTTGYDYDCDCSGYTVLNNYVNQICACGRLTVGMLSRVISGNSPGYHPRYAHCVRQ